MPFTSWLRNLRSVRRLGTSACESRRASHRGAANRFHPQLDILEARCLLSFSPAVAYPVGADPRAVVSGDFNGDGAPTWP
jgi:hypothetical protein